MEKYCSRCRLQFTTEYYWQNLCKNCFKVTKNEEVLEYKRQINDLTNQLFLYKVKKSEIGDIDFLKSILKLVHPDKHDNSILSNRITVEILQMIKNKKDDE
jgi:hypothetical protein